MRPLARRCALALLVVAPLAAATSSVLQAQSVEPPAPARRFTLAAGPTFALESGPPNLGGHLRGSMALGTIPRPLNLVADAYVSYLPFGSTTLPEAGPGSFETNELQIGTGLSGVLTLFPSRSVAPYLLVGGVVRWSSVESSFTPAPGNATRAERVSGDATQGDILLGLGTHIRHGGRLVSIEARIYGGSAINMPVTVGISF
jgi:hypothetical protein